VMYCNEFKSLLCVAEKMQFGLTLMDDSQIGDNSTIDRYTPVAVVGLSSGIAILALGWVSYFI
jgi:hypothetical protein